MQALKIAAWFFGLPLALLFAEVGVSLRPDVLGIPISTLQPADYRGFLGCWLIVGWFCLMGIGIWYRIKRDNIWKPDVVAVTFAIVAATACGGWMLDHHARPQMYQLAEKVIGNVTGPNSYIADQQKRVRTTTGSIRKKPPEDEGIVGWWKKNVKPGDPNVQP